MGIVSKWYNRPGRGVAKDEPRKKGGARFLELTLRDGGHFLAANLLLCLAAAPGIAGAAAGLYRENPAAAVLAGAAGGALAGPFFAALCDTLLRALRDEAGYWGHVYRRALRANAAASLLPGAIFGTLTAAQAAALLSMINRGGTVWGYAALFAGLLATAAFSAVLWPQLVLLELPFGALVKNSALLVLAYPRRTLPAALAGVCWWGAFGLLAPYSLLLMPLLGFWYIQLVVLMLVYPPIDAAFHIEQTLEKRRAPGVEPVMRDDVTRPQDPRA